MHEGTSLGQVQSVGARHVRDTSCGVTVASMARAGCMRLGIRPVCAAQGYDGRCGGCRVRVGLDFDGTALAAMGDCMRLRLRLLGLQSCCCHGVALT